jgi:anti-sigma regulatory factor (Ser/Thr protein kinase)
MESFRLVLERSDRAVALARHATHAWVKELHAHNGLADDATLVVSELVTNAILHTDSAPVLEGRYAGGRLRLEVLDGQPTPPVVKLRGDENGGYGLRIVSRLSSAWGWTPVPDGKRVWAELTG